MLVRMIISESPDQTAPSVPKIIKLFPCSSQQSTKLILPINVKMPTIGILTFISMISKQHLRDLKGTATLIITMFNVKDIKNH